MSRQVAHYKSAARSHVPQEQQRDAPHYQRSHHNANDYDSSPPRHHDKRQPKVYHQQSDGPVYAGAKNSEMLLNKIVHILRRAPDNKVRGEQQLENREKRKVMNDSYNENSERVQANRRSRDHLKQGDQGSDYAITFGANSSQYRVPSEVVRQKANRRVVQQVSTDYDREHDERLRELYDEVEDMPEIPLMSNKGFAQNQYEARQKQKPMQQQPQMQFDYNFIPQQHNSFKQAIETQYYHQGMNQYGPQFQSYHHQHSGPNASVTTPQQTLHQFPSNSEFQPSPSEFYDYMEYQKQFDMELQMKLKSPPQVRVSEGLVGVNPFSKKINQQPPQLYMGGGQQPSTQRQSLPQQVNYNQGSIITSDLQSNEFNSTKFRSRSTVRTNNSNNINGNQKRSSIMGKKRVASQQEKILIIPDVGKNTFRKAKIINLDNSSNFENSKNSTALLNALDQLKDHKSTSGNHRLIYEGYHRIPVFNLKVSDKPVLLPLAFSVYRVGHKVYFEASQSIPASLLILQPELRAEKRNASYSMINKNSQLILDTSEKMAAKYLSLSDNSFARLIEDKIIVANQKLQIEKLSENTPRGNPHTQRQNQETSKLKKEEALLQAKIKNYEEFRKKPEVSYQNTIPSKLSPLMPPVKDIIRGSSIVQADPHDDFYKTYHKQEQSYKQGPMQPNLQFPQLQYSHGVSKPGDVYQPQFTASKYGAFREQQNEPSSTGTQSTKQTIESYQPRFRDSFYQLRGQQERVIPNQVMGSERMGGAYQGEDYKIQSKLPQMAPIGHQRQSQQYMTSLRNTQDTHSSSSSHRQNRNEKPGLPTLRPNAKNQPLNGGSSDDPGDYNNQSFAPLKQTPYKKTQIQRQDRISFETTPSQREEVKDPSRFRKASAEYEINPSIRQYVQEGKQPDRDEESSDEYYDEEEESERFNTQSLMNKTPQKPFFNESERHPTTGKKSSGIKRKEDQPTDLPSVFHDEQNSSKREFFETPEKSLRNTPSNEALRSALQRSNSGEYVPSLNRNPSNQRNDKYLPLQQAIEEEKTEEDLAADNDDNYGYRHGSHQSTDKNTLKRKAQDQQPSDDIEDGYSSSQEGSRTNLRSHKRRLSQGNSSAEQMSKGAFMSRRQSQKPSTHKKKWIAGRVAEEGTSGGSQEQLLSNGNESAHFPALKI
ncbi:hypothetical protein FGO68_gene10874 [Halteria grandinella]|uniref:Uncharacterized protein n=1 Tax=Halteria grandinella TaxID=5974 RepID=A0A8J8P3R8_HALGN|nr:hypothetical protein FGO68_gene10874 [Halteria grandinella]